MANCPRPIGRRRIEKGAAVNRSYPRHRAYPAQSSISIFTREATDEDIPTVIANSRFHQRIGQSRKHQVPFLKGPIPMPWLCAAAQIPGKAINLAVAIRHIAGMQGPTKIKLNKKLLNELRISQDACADGLHKLEAAGLVRVTRKLGQRPLIDICEMPAQHAVDTNDHCRER